MRSPPLSASADASRVSSPLASAPDAISAPFLSAMAPPEWICVPSISPSTSEAAMARPEPQRCRNARSEEHTSELQSLMRISYAVFCLKKKKNKLHTSNTYTTKSNHNDTQAKKDN